MKQRFPGFRYNPFIMRAIAVTFFLNICSFLGFPSILVGTKIDNYDDSNYEYQELFTEGKEWIIWHGAYDLGWNSCHMVIYVSVDGEEIIDGIKCKRLKYYCESASDLPQCTDCQRRETVNGTRYFYGYEKDRKIYIYRNPGKECYYIKPGLLAVRETEPYFDIYMDLNVELGELVFDMGEIDKIDYRDFNGTIRRVIASSSECDNIPEIGNECNWIEGIGSNMVANQYATYFHSFSMVNRPVPEHPGSPSEMYNSVSFNLLLQCSENGVPIYDNMDRLREYDIDLDMVRLDMIRETSNTTSIEINETSGMDIYYNMQGMPVDNPRKGEIYIYNGKKLIY